MAGVAPAHANPIYEPLDADREEIRLLILLPDDNPEDRPRCYLETVSLSKDPQPQYEAISYCWSEMEGTTRIRLNGLRFDAPASAAKVLERFRPTKGLRLLWLDALCINQNDIHEKARQISLMTNVYSLASCTLVWIGDSDSSTHTAIDRLKMLHKSHPFATGQPKDIRRDLPADFKWDKDSLLATWRFLGRPWFKRTWVLPEVAKSHAAICYCGDYILPWNELGDAVEVLCDQANSRSVQLLPDPDKDYLRTSSEMSNWHHGAIMVARTRDFSNFPKLFENVLSTPSTLGGHLLVGRGLGACDSRDKVFGFLGLVTVPRASAHLLQVDYAKPYGHVFRDAVRADIINDGLLMLEVTLLEIEAVERLKRLDRKASEIRAKENATQNLPSWVPRLDIETEDDLIAKHLYSGLELFPSKHRQNSSELLRPRDPDCLTLRGYDIDEVSKILESLPLVSKFSLTDSTCSR